MSLRIELIETTETTIKIKLISSFTSALYSLQYKKQEVSTWDNGSVISKSCTDDGSHLFTADECEPGTTYCIRIVGIVDDANMKDDGISNILTVDTDPIGCTPGQKSGGCGCVIS